MSLKLLHLSDIHIGKTHFKSNEFVAHIEKALRDMKCTIDAIVVTGDVFDAEVFHKPKYKTYIIEAIGLFECLIEKLNKNLGCNLSKENVFFIPGNHEINRKSKDPYDKYRYFIKRFYKEIPSEYDSKKLWFFKIYSDIKIVLLGFNSTMYKDNEDYGEISMEQISNLTAHLDSIENKEDYSVVALLHHHFYYIEERNKDYKDYSVLRNGQSFMSGLRKYNLYAILHGHKHESTNRRIIINDNIRKEDKIVNVIACGSSGKQDTAYNSFNFIEIFDVDSRLDLSLTEFIFENSIFDPKETIDLPIINKTTYRVSLLDEFEIHNQKLFREYIILKDIDTNTPVDELIETLNFTVGSLTDSAELIEKDTKIIFYLLLPLHFRSKKCICLDEFKQYILKNLKSEFNTQIKRKLFFKILESDNIYSVYNSYYELMDGHDLSDKEKKYLSFLMISWFLSEHHLVLRERIEEFFKIRIKSKSNINFKSNTLKRNILGNTISFIADEERRSIDISINCKNANAHKVISLVIKEFALELSRFEDDFAKVGFNIYYIIPKIKSIVKNREKHIESYNFEAYIPTLIPLLAGENIYYQPEVFARELIQNSIDAINVRKTTPSMEWDGYGKIEINFGTENHNRYIEITDNGTGMNKYTLERYFTSIGRSFYNSDDYMQLGTKYKPISKFGIGLLSCFLVGKRIKVYTKYCLTNTNSLEYESYLLEIPNFDGCFFIENNDNKNIGTSIRVYEDNEKDKFKMKRIISYIQQNIINPSVELSIMNGKNIINIRQNKFLEKLVEDTKKNRLLFIQPLPLKNDQNKNGLDIDRFFNEKEYRFENRYGIFIFKRDSELNSEQKDSFNCAGIKIKKFEKLLDNVIEIIGDYFDIYVNLPSELVDLDVSRDTIKSIIKIENIILQLSKSFKKMKLEYIDSCSMINNLPYFILRELDNERFGIDKLICDVKDDFFAIKFEDNPSLINSHCSVITKWFFLIFHDYYLENYKGYAREKTNVEFNVSNHYRDFSRVVLEIYKISLHLEDTIDFFNNYEAFSSKLDDIRLHIEEEIRTKEYTDYLRKSKKYMFDKKEIWYERRYSYSNSNSSIVSGVPEVDSKLIFDAFSELYRYNKYTLDNIEIHNMSRKEKMNLINIYYIHTIWKNSIPRKFSTLHHGVLFSLTFKIMFSTHLMQLLGARLFSLSELKEGLSLDVHKYFLEKYN